jgi:hypothetical protein
MAGPDAAEAKDAVILDEDHCPPSTGRQPCPHEFVARRREEVAVIGDDPAGESERAREAQFDQPDIGNLRRGREPAIADVAVGEGEARLRIVGLLRDDAIEPDGAVRQFSDAGLPYLHAVALAAEIRMTDIEAEEGEIRPVADDRDAGRRPVVDDTKQESVGICGCKSRNVVEARIPALGFGPADDQRDLRRSSCPDLNAMHSP